MKAEKKTLVQVGFDIAVLIVSNFSGTAFSIFFSILMTRFLLPVDYGFIASKLFIFSLLNWLSDWGFEQALLAWSDGDFLKAAGTHLSMRFAFGFLPVIILSILWLFNLRAIEQSFIVLLVLACSFFFQKVGFTFKTVLEREGRLKRLAGLELFASIFSIFLAFCMAMRGFGALSLAGQLFVERAILLVGYFFACEQRIIFNFDLVIAKKFFSTFGLPSTLSATFGLAIYDFMPFLIDRLSGVAEAGLYARSFSIATMPLMITGVFGRISNSLYCQNQFDQMALSKWFCSLQLLKGFLIVPAQLFLMITVPWWSTKLFSGRWAGLSQVYLILAIYGLVRSFYDDSTNLISIGFKAPWKFTESQAIHFLMIMTCGPILVYLFRAKGGAFAMAISMLLVTVRFWTIIFKFLALSVNKFFNLACSTLYFSASQFLQTGRENLVFKKLK